MTLLQEAAGTDSIWQPPEVFGDFSVWQGVIDWSAYKAGGYKRVGIKAVEGIGFIDPRFYDNEIGSRGLQRIFYGYTRPDLNPGNPEGEARFLWDTVSPFLLPGDALENDYEQQGASVNYEDWKLRWAAAMQHLYGFGRFGMYSANWFMIPRGITWAGVGFTHQASYGPEVGGVDIQQYTSSASFPGVQGGCDANWLLNPAALAGGEVDVTPDECRAVMIGVLNSQWDKTYGIGGSPTAYQDGPAAILDADRKTATVVGWNNADLEQFKTKDLPAIQAEAKRIADAIWAAGGHPADVAINEALKNINNLVNGAVTKIDAVKADTAEIRGRVDKDLAP